MTVIDVSAAAGWWTDIIAPSHPRPALHRRMAPGRSEELGEAREETFEAKYDADPKLYGDVKISVGFGRKLTRVAARAVRDLVSREIHDWAQVNGSRPRRSAISAPR